MDKLEFGIDYIIPKPLDLRLIEWESAAVAQAAMDTGVARKKIDIEEYKKNCVSVWLLPENASESFLRLMI